MRGHEALFNKLNATSSEIELVGFLRELTSNFDFSGFLILDIPAEVEQRITPKIALSNLPSGFLEAYDALGLLKNSPVIAALRRSTAPVIWSRNKILTSRPPEEVGPALQLYESHGYTVSVFFPVHGANGARAALGFVGNCEEPSHTELGELGIFVMYAYDIYSNLRNKLQATTTALTRREIEVLHWAAHGKTSAEIAAIVALSDHTINAYMNSAMRKLDCVNRTQLVAKALRLHLIS